MIMQSDFMMRR